MSRIAVSGGAGGLGKTFVQALSKTKHEVFVLSRSQERQLDSSNVKYIKVDYSDIDSIATLLETNNIDTVLSAITMESSTTSQAQLNLILAAEKSIATKRFIPSEFGVIANAETAALDPYAKYWVANAEALAKTKTLQYTRISTGQFMDYWGMPNIKTTLNPFTWAIDIENGVAAIPGTGNEKMSMTYTPDVAQFIIKMLDEPDWPVLSGFVGQDVTFNEMLGWAESATGRKFKVSYDSIEKLEKGEVTNLTELMAKEKFLRDATIMFGIMTVTGHIFLPDQGGFRVNERFPDLKVMTVEKLIKEAWTKNPISA
ncbi:NAD(P)-binding protein [Cadophora sp. DSE1049]|nr:NAD(P)-binding protein [Cadophora sp. DSE1049]